jgi:hypothetical protein
MTRFVIVLLWAVVPGVAGLWSCGAALAADEPKARATLDGHPGAAESAAFSPPVHNGSRITGMARVLIEAEQTSLKGNIDGKAVVLVIVSKGGTLEFKGKIAGEAQVYWCKADDADPDPKSKTAPSTSGKAKFNQVKRAEMDKLIEEHKLK